MSYFRCEYVKKCKNLTGSKFGKEGDFVTAHSCIVMRNEL